MPNKHGVFFGTLHVKSFRLRIARRMYPSSVSEMSQITKDDRLGWRKQDIDFCKEHFLGFITFENQE